MTRIHTQGEGAHDDDPALRPPMLRDFAGQPHVRAQLGSALRGAEARDEALEHVLLHGPPGLGKTTLAAIVANEMGSRLRVLSGPAIGRIGDIVAVLAGMSRRDVLFIDEIHRTPVTVLETLYAIMEDFKVSLVPGDPGAAAVVELPFERFTLVGATTRSGMLPQPLRERFGISLELEMYSLDDMTSMVERSARLLGMDLAPGVARAVASRSRGTPRRANHLLRRVRDEATGHRVVGMEAATSAFDLLRLDARGLGRQDRQYLRLLGNRFAGRAVGLKTLAAAMDTDAQTVEDMIEPYLLACGLVDKTPSGRRLGAGVAPEGPEGDVRLAAT